MLHCAYRLIANPQPTADDIDMAESFVKRFVHDFKELFGHVNVVSNVHNLLHITDCVRLYGCVESFVAYKFENFMQHF